LVSVYAISGNASTWTSHLFETKLPSPRRPEGEYTAAHAPSQRIRMRRNRTVADRAGLSLPIRKCGENSRAPFHSQRVQKKRSSVHLRSVAQRDLQTASCLLRPRTAMPRPRARVRSRCQIRVCSPINPHLKIYPVISCVQHGSDTCQITLDSVTGPEIWV